MSAQPYDRMFYSDQRTASRRSASVIVPFLMQECGPRSVVDVGCGVGTWLAEFMRAGVDQFVGYDGDYVDRASLQIPSEKFRPADLQYPISDTARYDLCVSLEVAEHIPSDSAGDFVSTLTGLSDVVAFSAAVPGQGGTHHVNEQWQSFWIELFGAAGYGCLDVVRPRFWTHPEVDYYYAQNMFLFKRGVTSQLAISDVVHPAMWERDPSGLSFRPLLSRTLESGRHLAPALARTVSRKIAQRRGGGTS